jgi:hypothetical protein
VTYLDPRVHFALNYGARSCPPLAAWRPEDLDERLHDAARTYLTAETSILDGGEVVRVPRLLLWYLGDFGGRPGILGLLRRYAVIDGAASPAVRFADCDWRLDV